jgi:filamentous hemagglutinin family protein
MTTKPNTKTAGKSYSRNGLNLRRKALHLAVASCFSITPAFAATTNLASYNYATHAGMVTGDTTIGNMRTIYNNNNAILNWNSGLNINTGETLRFQQLNSASKVLNRIGGGNATNILGTLSSNGKVYLINNAGIVFGKGSTVDVGGGLVASSLNITDSDFISGRNRFNADVANPGKVSNAGAITTPNGGFVYLIAPQVENSGVITTPGGEAILAAGNSVELVDSADPSLRVVVRAKTQDVNLSALMTQSNGQIFSVLNSGKISANSAVVGQNGKIQLRSAGNLQTTASSVLEAKGTTTTDGGLIRGFANGTGNYAGTFDVSGRNGGHIETSAAFLHLDPNITILARAMVAGGHGGTWLLDPYDYTIGPTEAGIINSAFTNSGVSSITIDTGNNSSFGFNGAGGGTAAGNITINSAITAAYSGSPNYAQTLNLQAYGAVAINAPITNANNSKLTVNINADEDSSGNGGVAFNSNVNVGGNVIVQSNSGNITMPGAATFIQANIVNLDTKNGSIGSATSYIKTKTSTLAIGHSGSNPVTNAYIADATALDRATLLVNPNSGTASLFLTGGLLSNSRIDLYGDNKVVTSGTGLNMAGGHITFYGGGVGTVAVNGDLNMVSGAFIGNYSTSNGGDVNVAATNLSMNNSYIEGGSQASDKGNVTLEIGGNLTMAGGSSIDTQGSGGDITIAASHLSMLNSSISNGYGSPYAGDIFIGAVGVDVLNNSTIGGNNNPVGDTVIFAHDLNVSGHSTIYGHNVGINFFPGDIDLLTSVTSIPALDSFYKTSTVTVSYGGSIVADHGLGIRTGTLTLTTSDGNGHDAPVFIGANNGSMALFVSGDLSISGGNKSNAYAYSGYMAGIFAADELFLKVGGKLSLNTSSDGTGAATIEVGSSQTLFMDFPFATANGWTVDGVSNAFSSSINPNSGIFVKDAPGVIGTNTFVNYGDGLTSSSALGALKSFQSSELLKATNTNNNNTNSTSTSDTIFGSDDEDSGNGNGGKNKKSAPRQCS